MANINKETGISIGVVVIIFSGIVWLLNSIEDKADKIDVKDIRARQEKHYEELVENDKLDMRQSMILEKLEERLK
jgi:hypothetical protein